MGIEIKWVFFKGAEFDYVGALTKYGNLYLFVSLKCYMPWMQSDLSFIYELQNISSQVH